MRLLAGFCLVLACWYPASRSRADSTVVTSEPRTWEFSGALYYYALPDESDLPSPVVQARYGRLHLEGRYNYEDRQTASFFVGCAFEAGEKLYVELVPLAGLAVGNTTGLVPGYELTVSLDPVELYSEGEYLKDLADESANFVYVWSQLTVSLPAGFLAGVVGQRTVLYQTEPEINPGILAGIERAAWGGALYLFNPGRDDSYVVVSLNADF